mmetsp:Transcript_106637/g.340281  ORF Transcript_106637/g.340281 Transcript_106637/m.340281 type:complete len:288 (+) Transcript_106637:48-911(+)
MPSLEGPSQICLLTGAVPTNNSNTLFRAGRTKLQRIINILQHRELNVRPSDSAHTADATFFSSSACPLPILTGVASETFFDDGDVSSPRRLLMDVANIARLASVSAKIANLPTSASCSKTSKFCQRSKSPCSPKSSSCKWALKAGMSWIFARISCTSSGRAACICSTLRAFKCLVASSSCMASWLTNFKCCRMPMLSAAASSATHQARLKSPKARSTAITWEKIGSAAERNDIMSSNLFIWQWMLLLSLSRKGGVLLKYTVAPQLQTGCSTPVFGSTVRAGLCAQID